MCIRDSHDVIHHTTEKQGVPVEVALTYNTSYQENVYTYVNDIHTIEGGTHLTGFRRGLTRTLKKYATCLLYTSESTTRHHPRT